MGGLWGRAAPRPRARPHAEGPCFQAATLRSGLSTPPAEAETELREQRWSQIPQLPGAEVAFESVTPIPSTASVLG